MVQQTTGKEMKHWELGKLYKGKGVTAQKPVSRLGRPKPKPYEEEVKEIEDLQAQLQAFADDGYEIVCVDECIFSPKSLQIRPQFAPSGQPLEYSHQKKKLPYVAVVGFAGTRSGFNHWELLDAKAFDRWDFINAVKRHHQKMAGEKYALFLDNATIHRAKDTKMMTEILRIPLVFNVAYRPDFNGIEYVWGWAKQAYRKRMAASLIGTKFSKELTFSNRTMVDRVLLDVPQDLAKTQVRRGWEQLAVGKPMQPHFPGGVPDVGNPYLDELEAMENLGGPGQALPAEDQPMGEDSDGHSVDEDDDGDISDSMEFEQEPEP